MTPTLTTSSACAGAPAASTNAANAAATNFRLRMCPPLGGRWRPVAQSSRESGAATTAPRCGTAGGGRLPKAAASKAAAGLEEFDLFRGRSPAQNGVAMEKAAETIDDLAVPPRVGNHLAVAERLAQFDRARLHRAVFSVHERQIEKMPPCRIERPIEAERDGAPRSRQRHTIGGKGFGPVAIEIARKLVERDHRGQRRFRRHQRAGRRSAA